MALTDVQIRALKPKAGTHFDYSNLKASPTADGGLTVSFVVKNSGGMASDEVPQVYLGAPMNALQGASFAVHALAAFDRIHLSPGDSQTVRLHVPLRSLQYWSTAKNQWVKALGPRLVLVGRSSRDLPLQSKVMIAN